MRTLYISDSEDGPTRYLLRIDESLFTSIGEAAHTNPTDGRTMYRFQGFGSPRLCMNALFRLLMGRADWKKPSRRGKVAVPSPATSPPWPLDLRGSKKPD